MFTIYSIAILLSVFAGVYAKFDGDFNPMARFNYDVDQAIEAEFFGDESASQALWQLSVDSLSDHPCFN